jgi:hypothetical protein
MTEIGRREAIEKDVLEAARAGRWNAGTSATATSRTTAVAMGRRRRGAIRATSLQAGILPLHGETDGRHLYRVRGRPATDAVSRSAW